MPAAASSGERRSVELVWQTPPEAEISSFSESRASSERASAPMAQPPSASAFAMPRPIPALAPVTITFTVLLLRLLVRVVSCLKDTTPRPGLEDPVENERKNTR